MKRQADLLTGISCMISQGKVVVISCRIQIRERDDGTVKAPWDVHQAATWSLCRYKRTDPASTHCAKGARHRARLISVWPSDFQNAVWRFSSHECAGVDPKTPNAHQNFNTFNNDSKAAQQDSQLTHETCVCSVRDCVKMVSERRGYRGRRVLHFCHLLMKTFNDVKSLHFTESSVSS